jgi:hypothetical protein
MVKLKFARSDSAFEQSIVVRMTNRSARGEAQRRRFWSSSSAIDRDGHDDPFVTW